MPLEVEFKLLRSFLKNTSRIYKDDARVEETIGGSTRDE